MISDLDRDDLPGVEVLQSIEAMALFLDFTEAEEDPPLGIENRRLIAAPRQRRLPGGEQRVLGFHHLRRAPSAASMPALFPP